MSKKTKKVRAYSMQAPLVLTVRDGDSWTGAQAKKASDWLIGLAKELLNDDFRSHLSTTLRARYYGL